jgi:protein TonB
MQDSVQRISLTPESFRPPPPAGVVRASDEPMEKVLSLSKKGQAAPVFALATVLHVLGAGLALVVALWGTLGFTRDALARVKARVFEYEMIVTKEESPPPPPKEEEKEPEPVKTVAPQPVAAPPPPPPAAAQAGKTLTAEPKADDPYDMTNFTITQGNNDNYAGGTTRSDGTNKEPPKGPVAAPGAPTGTGTVAAPPPPPPPAPTVDKSRAARTVNDDWNCPFPPEADSAQIDSAQVIVEVQVGPNGAPSGVKVLSDPGNGFGREALRCAMRQRFTPALDRDGNTVPGVTRVRVRFDR